jgi:predicted lipoprotein with Yx(FWY)xxD motif
MMRHVTLLAGFLLAVPAFAQTSLPAAVKARSTDVGIFYETADGYTLYTYDKDVAPNVSTCVGDCAKAWPPFLADDAAQASGAWTISQRADGGRQWSYKGKPLYKYARDTAPGVALGGGLQDIWHVAVDLAPRPKGVVYQSTVEGRVAATTKGATLYVSKTSCTAACLTQREPFLAPWTANAIGDWSVVIREDDQSKQWAYRGQPVYTFTGDTAPGDIKGQDSAWTPVRLEPPMPVPAWVTVQVSDHGPIFADPKGMTLYAINTDMDELKRLYCDDACMAATWAPVMAKEGETAVGNWTIAKDGQWHYRAEPVFTYKFDKVPSDLKGDRFAVGNGFGGFHVLRRETLIEETL